MLAPELKTISSPTPDPFDTNLDVLRQVEQRVLWLATRIIDVANRREADGSAGTIKVGGHQASCASLVSVMTALWFAHIGGDDKVSVKPHAAPVYHAIKYLTGELDRSYLTTLRQRGGLQAYPSRTKDPDVADFSTGSVGLGAVAPLFSAATRRYVDCHFGAQPAARFIAIVGDAELDEGNVWEAISDPTTADLGNFTMVIDLNRQSLDRVIPDIQATRLISFFNDAGWHVAVAKYGSRLTAAFDQAGGEALRAHIDAMANEAYQSLFAAGQVLFGCRRGRTALGRWVGQRRAEGRGDRSRGPRSGVADRHVPIVRRSQRPAQRGVRLHHQGLGTPHCRRSPQPRRALEPRPDRRLPGPSRSER
jgi:pyruvate dehydrogenase E1 component